MRFHIRAMVCLVLVVVFPYGQTQAQLFRIDFNITGFDISNGNNPPTNPVTGWIKYEAPSITGNIQSIADISLTIDGYSYSTSDVGFTQSGPYQFIGGVLDPPFTLNPVTTVASLTNDFWIRWDQSTLIPDNFIYSSANVSGGWDAWYALDDFTHFSISAVPVPPALWLFGSGLLGLFGLANCKNSA